MTNLPILRSLKHRKFAFLLFGQTLSRIGDFLFQIALAWWVLEETGSAVAMGTVLIFSFVPMLVFMLIGGVLVDRFPRARILFLSDLARGLIMVTATFIVLTDRFDIWVVYLISFLFGLADAFFMPAYTALIPQIVPQEDLTSANSLNSLSTQFGRIAGPALGGIFTGFLGTSFAFGFNAVSFFIGTLTVIPLLSLSLPAAPADAESTPSHFLADLRDGFRTVTAVPMLWISILTFAVGNVTLSGPYSVAMPFLVKDHLGGDEKMLGFFYSIFPIGYAVASLIAGNMKRLRYRGIVFYVCGVISSIGLGVFGLDFPIWALVIAALLNGAALEIEGLIWANLLQQLVPPEKLGRVSSIDNLGSFALLPIGYAVAGWAVEQVGAATVFVAAGSASALLCMLPLLHPAIRKLD